MPQRIAYLGIVVVFVACQLPENPGAPTYRTTQETWYRWQDSAWVESSRVLYTYADSLVTERLAQSWVADEARWINSLYDITDYNADGQRIQWQRHTWQDSSWTPQVRRTFGYDAAGQLVAQHDTMWHAPPSVPAYVRHTFVYNAVGDLVEDLSEKREDNAWVAHARTVSTYNEAGHHLEQQFQTWDGTAWQTPRRLLREYKADGLHSASLRQSWRDSMWQDALRYDFVLADDGRRLEEHWKRPSEAGWQNLTKVVYHFETRP